MVVDPARSCEEVSIMGEGERRSKSTRLSFREEGEKKLIHQIFLKGKRKKINKYSKSEHVDQNLSNFGQSALWHGVDVWPIGHVIYAVLLVYT